MERHGYMCVCVCLSERSPLHMCALARARVCNLFVCMYVHVCMNARALYEHQGTDRLSWVHITLSNDTPYCPKALQQEVKVLKTNQNSSLLAEHTRSSETLVHPVVLQKKKEDEYA